MADIDDTNGLLTTEQAAVLSGAAVSLVDYWGDQHLDAARSADGRRWFRPDDVHILRALLVAEAQSELFDAHEGLVVAMRALNLPADWSGWLLVTEELDVYLNPDAALASVEHAGSRWPALHWLGPPPTELPDVSDEVRSRAGRSLQRNTLTRQEAAQRLLYRLGAQAVREERGGLRAIAGLADLLASEPAWDDLTDEQLAGAATILLEMRR